MSTAKTASSAGSSLLLLPSLLLLVVDLLKEVERLGVLRVRILELLHACFERGVAGGLVLATGDQRGGEQDGG